MGKWKENAVISVENIDFYVILSNFKVILSFFYIIISIFRINEPFYQFF